MGELSLANHTHSDYADSNHTHSEYASNSHNHSTSEITSGTLPLTRGGTGVTTLAALKTALGISSGGANPSVIITPTIGASNSSSYTLDVTNRSCVLVYEYISTYENAEYGILIKKSNKWYINIGTVISTSNWTTGFETVSVVMDDINSLRFKSTSDNPQCVFILL